MRVCANRARSTLLFSHGNATDLGAMRDHLLNMSEHLCVNIFAYDYAGYGLSSGKPSPANTLADAECAYKHLRDTIRPAIIEEQKRAHAEQQARKANPSQRDRDKPPADAAPADQKSPAAAAAAAGDSKQADAKDSKVNDPLWHPILCYGQSLGSGPTFHIGSKYPAEVSGLIVHSGLMSGLRVIRPVENTKWFDIFPNIDRARQVTAPVFIMHGTADKEIPVHHGIGLSENAPNLWPP
jgi:pimeloyl-ACP methyl ester carboxylesterase